MKIFNNFSTSRIIGFLIFLFLFFWAIEGKIFSQDLSACGPSACGTIDGMASIDVSGAGSCKSCSATGCAPGADFKVYTVDCFDSSGATVGTTECCCCSCPPTPTPTNTPTPATGARVLLGR